MKKIYLALILSFMFIFSISANAADGYAPLKNSYTNSISDGAKTVIIYKGTSESDMTSENIYYINQCDDTEGFANLEMMMKADAPAGTYTVLINGGGRTTFEISTAQAAISGANEVTFLGAEKTGEASYSAAFGFSAETLLTNVSSLTMVIGDTAYTTEMFGDASIINWGSGYIYTEGQKPMFAIQLDNIDEGYMTETEGKMIPNFGLYVK